SHHFVNLHLQDILADLPRAVPRSAIGVSQGNHLVLTVYLDDPSLGVCHVLPRAQYFIDFKEIVVSGGYVALDACPSQPFVSKPNPRLEAFYHQSLEEPDDEFRFRLQLLELLAVRDIGIPASVPEAPAQRLYLGLRLQRAIRASLSDPHRP